MKALAPLFIFFSLMCSITSTYGAENPREINFVGVNDELLLNVERHVRLVKRLRDKKGTALLMGERQRLESRVESEIKQALQPFGYYKAEVSLDERKLPKAYRYVVTLNEPVLINSVQISLNAEALAEPELAARVTKYPLKKGMRLNQAIYTNEKKSLLSTAIRLGYFDARFVRSEMTIDEARTSASILLDFNSGQRYSVSKIVIDWDLETISDRKSRKGIDESILDSLISVKKDQFYTAGSLAKTQQSLLATPYFSAVNVRTGERDRQNALVPVLIKLTPSKRKAYNFAVGVGTDTGFRASIGYENRRINRHGHHTNARIGGSEIERAAIFNYRVPLSRSARDSLNFYASLEEEFGDTRRFEATRIGSEWAFESYDSLFKLGLQASRESYERIEDDLLSNEVSTDLLMPSLSWERTSSDDSYSPTRGWSASAKVRGASASLGSDINLVQGLFKGRVLHPFGPGRIKLRFQLSGSLIDEAIDIPESLGFLAGGDDSVRGYAYESIGVNRNGEISIAKNLAVGSLEYQHPIRNGLALAAFIDAGDAFDGSANYKKGAGLGLRWRLPFGALRLDAASALDLDGDPIRIHFSFGTDL